MCEKKEAKSEVHQTIDGHPIFNMIAQNYLRLEQSIVQELYFQAEHGTTIGTFREAVWKELFEQIIPKKFVVEQSVFILDSHGSVSKEVDLVILDEMYTPYIFRQGHLKFIPIEAVAVAIECKSENLNKKVDEIKEWKKQLKTSKRAIEESRVFLDMCNQKNLQKNLSQTLHVKNVKYQSVSCSSEVLNN